MRQVAVVWSLETLDTMTGVAFLIGLYPTHTAALDAWCDQAGHRMPRVTSWDLGWLTDTVAPAPHPEPVAASEPSQATKEPEAGQALPRKACPCGDPECQYLMIRAM